ncbi:MAG: hypothetical protein MMC33_008533 [Icmadophila ericetorum]|nr:hypothetical protein [Icmadophila ericetorum]
MTGGSGFYGSGCTDPNFGYPCTLKCGDQTKPDIVFNATSGLWNCCGADSQKIVHCQSPIDETVDAPAPSLLTTLGLIGGEGLFTPASTSMPTPSSSIIGSIQTSTTSTSRLQLASSTISGTVQSSRTLAVGILGIAIDALIGVALLFFAILLVLRRKRAPCFEGTSDDGGDILQTSNYDNELQGTPVSELQLRSSIRLPELNG